MKFAADENFKSKIIRGLRRRNPWVDIVGVREAGLEGADDPTVLDWAAREGRILITHDIATISSPAYERVLAGLPMPAGSLQSSSFPPHGSSNRGAADAH
jgi:Domain of unknown function (DUF5615)